MKTALSLFLGFALLPSAVLGGNVTIDDVWGRAPVILYDLPEGDGRAEVIRYIEATRDQLKRGTAVSDAARKRTSLKEGFILYTTLTRRSGLLGQATRELGWSVADGSFRWRDVSVPVGEARWITVGRNPFGKGYCVVYAAGSNQGLNRINELYHGPSSYDVFRGDKLVKEGSYDERLRSIERVSKAEALEDVEQFFRTLKRVHPNLLARVSEPGFRKLQQQTVSAAGKKDEISVEELASLLYYAAAYFQDGHTSVDWWTPLNELNTRGKRFPAFHLRFENGRFLVAAAKDPSIVGTEVVRINDVPALEFLQPILDRCSGETLGFRAARFLDDEAKWYYLTNLFADGTPYVMTVRDMDGNTRDTRLETLTYMDYLGHELFRPNSEGTKVEFFDSGATAHLMYSSFNLSAAQKKNVDDVFAEIKAKGARNLIVDVRGNGGGQSAMADHIFRYLYDGKFRSLSKVRVKASRDITPWWALPAELVLNGRMVCLPVRERTRVKPSAFFSGRTYLLTDHGTFSMAAEFAAMFRDYSAGTIIGYETGGLADTFAGPHHFVLRHSRISCMVAFTEILPSRPRAGDQEHGVLPDVPIREEKIARFREEQDPVLAFALRYIAAN